MHVHNTQACMVHVHIYNIIHNYASIPSEFPVWNVIVMFLSRTTSFEIVIMNGSSVLFSNTEELLVEMVITTSGLPCVCSTGT